MTGKAAEVLPIPAVRNFRRVCRAGGICYSGTASRAVPDCRPTLKRARRMVPLWHFGTMLVSLAVGTALSQTAPLTHIGDIAVSPVTQRVEAEAMVFDGTHPRFSGIGDAAAQKRLNARMAEWEKEALARTKAAAVTMRDDDRSEQRKAEGVFSYEVKRNSGGVVSLLFSEYQYAGGANGLDVKTGLTFFTDSGSLLKLPGLFSNSEEGLRQVNALIRAQLRERGLESQLLVSDPEVDQEAPFYLTDTALVIVVPELTWFPHVLGTVEFSLPFSQFSNCLRAEFQS